MEGDDERDRCSVHWLLAGELPRSAWPQLDLLFRMGLGGEGNGEGDCDSDADEVKDGNAS